MYYTGGTGVAAGYLHAPELTKDKFLADPFKKNVSRLDDSIAMVYRTGDLVRKEKTGLAAGQYSFIRRMVVLF